MRFGRLAAAAAFVIISAQAASAGVVVLTFAGLDNRWFADGPLNYYAGGLSLAGSGPGPNYGISFTDNAISCGPSTTGVCDGLAQPPTPGNFFYFAPTSSGSASVMNVAGGFSDGFAVYYSNIFADHEAQIYSGIDGTGTLLATLELSSTPNGFSIADCGGVPFCPFVPTGVAFSGVAHSVVFTDANTDVVFGDITIGSSVAAVPEPPMSILMTIGLAMGLAGIALTRRRPLTPDRLV